MAPEKQDEALRPSKAKFQTPVQTWDNQKGVYH